MLLTVEKIYFMNLGVTKKKSRQSQSFISAAGALFNSDCPKRLGNGMVLQGIDLILLFGTYHYPGICCRENIVMVKLVPSHISLILSSSLVALYVSVSLAHHNAPCV